MARDSPRLYNALYYCYVDNHPVAVSARRSFEVRTQTDRYLADYIAGGID